jgi:hypothetical protein
MAVKAGKFTVPSPSADFSITGLGFSPNAVIFLATNSTSEDVWTSNTTSLVCGSVGIASKTNSISNPTIIQRCSNEFWQSNDVGGTLNVNVVAVWVVGARAGSPGGWALQVNTFDADGFTMKWVSGYTSGGAGKVVYYLALGGVDTAEGFYTISDSGGSSTTALGFSPRGGFSVGSSDTDWADRASQSINAWGGGTSARLLAKGFVQTRTKMTEGGNPQGGYAISDCPACEPTRLMLMVWKCEEFPTNSLKITGDYGFDGSGILDGHKHKVLQLVCGAQHAYAVGSRAPSASVSATVTEETSIKPHGMVLFNVAGGPVAGLNGLYPLHQATSVGFVTPDFQCVIAYGGGPSSTAAMFQSSSASWVSNFTNPLPIGTTRTLGTAALLDTEGGTYGFTLTTTENSSAVVDGVSYWMIGEPVPVTYQKTGAGKAAFSASGNKEIIPITDLSPLIGDP